jgi:hypothetical protein
MNQIVELSAQPFEVAPHKFSGLSDVTLLNVKADLETSA